jgi:hypothetical protein
VAAFLLEESATPRDEEAARRDVAAFREQTERAVRDLVFARLAERALLTGRLDPYARPPDGSPPLRRGSERDFLDADGRLVPAARRTAGQEQAYTAYRRNTVAADALTDRVLETYRGARDQAVRAAGDR